MTATVVTGLTGLVVVVFHQDLNGALGMTKQMSETGTVNSGKLSMTTDYLENLGT